MNRDYSIGQHVIFVDELGKPHKALVTNWWGVALPGYTSSTGEPGCNVVYVDADEKKEDTYGRQIARMTSVVHKSKQPAHGMYWAWADEI